MGDLLVNLESLKNEEILEILEKYLIAYDIDEDGDIFLETPARLYLEVNKEKGVLRMYGFIHYKNYPNKEEIPKFVEQINNGSYTISYTNIDNQSILCEYRLYLLGSISEVGLIKSIRKTENELLRMKDALLYVKQILEE
ncbi:hypothetical protein G9X53_00530 [Cronobacter dublinensis]|uniref:hypothetical protein n=1 Tax=Cronobacter dublinensis TaxID=413497 RepID=UPI001411FCBC|nr:hypothetical protein [Cronobacter dublinensis]NHV87836.1 hypothetical protein [Cronobacter dublinensis]